MIDWLIDTPLAVTALMLLVLAVRRPVAHFFGAGWAYALWALPALRLVLPPLHLFGDAFPTLLPANQAAPGEVAVLLEPVQAAAAFHWEPLLLAAWVGGAALLILWQSCAYLAFIRRLGIGSHVQASFGHDIGIIESPEVEGPLAIGLLDRWIVVPVDFSTRYSLEEQRLALAHERIHHQREDILWNMVALGVLALNWFNPVAYLAFRAFRSDQELSCDAAVAARASRQERHDYALALVKSASRQGLIAACPLNHAGQLKRRLKMMKGHRRSRLRALGGSTSVAALLLAGISVTESASVAAPEPAPVAAPPAAASAAPPAPRAPTAAKERAAEQKSIFKAPKRRTKAAPVTAIAKAAAPAAAPAAPLPPAVAPEAAAPAPPSPLRRIIMVRVDGLERLALLGPPELPPRELRLVRTQVRTIRHADPNIKAQLEKLLAARIEEAKQVHHIILKQE